MSDESNTKPYMLFTTGQFPADPIVRVLKEGEDVEAAIEQELGGKPDREVTDDPLAIQLGVHRTLYRGRTSVNVISNPELEQDLYILRDQLIKENAIYGLLGIDPSKCQCGECDVDDEGYVTQSADTKAARAELVARQN